MRRFLPALLAFVLAVTTSFGWMPSVYVADTGMDMTAAVGSADQAEPAGHADVALDGCCGAGLAHASDGGQCSFHCAPAIWGTSTLRGMTASEITVLADSGGDGSATPTPFRPPVV